MPPADRRAPTVLYEDEDLLIVDKPPGLASVASHGVRGPTCADLVRREHPETRPVHRLDRETSGALLFARNPATLQRFKELFREQRVEKTYLALVRGAPRPAHGSIREPIAKVGTRATLSPRGQPARTDYRVLERLDGVSLVEARPITGRYNQIRLHLAARGHPLIGERKYARGKDDPLRFPRVALHALELAFPHPRTAREVRVRAPLAADLVELLRALGSRRDEG